MMLGHYATDKITKAKGVITARAEFLHSASRYELTPIKSEGNAEPVWYWLNRLTISGKQAVLASSPTLTILLGHEARDTVTGFKGIATARFIFLNGCVRVEVTPTELKDGAPVKPYVFDEQRLTHNSRVKKGGPFKSPPVRNTPTS
jgi:hypothetical protein